MIIIPSEELTLTEKARLRAQARDAGIARAKKKLALGPNEITFRAGQNIQDFGTVGREQWLTQNLAAVNTQYSLWTTLAAPAVGLVPQLPNNRVAVFWGAAIGTVPNPVTLLAFRKGPTAGTSMAVFDLEWLEPFLVTMGYFDEPVWYDPQEFMSVVVTAKIATGAQAQVILYCDIAEPVGGTIS